MGRRSSAVSSPSMDMAVLIGIGLVSMNSHLEAPRTAPGGSRPARTAKSPQHRVGQGARLTPLRCRVRDHADHFPCAPTLIMGSVSESSPETNHELLGGRKAAATSLAMLRSPSLPSPPTMFLWRRQPGAGSSAAASSPPVRPRDVVQKLPTVVSTPHRPPFEFHGRIPPPAMGMTCIEVDHQRAVGAPTLWACASVPGHSLVAFEPGRGHGYAVRFRWPWPVPPRYNR